MRRPSAFRPRVAVLLGVSSKWHIPLLVCRALSIAPATWWGLRCALLFLGELLSGSGVGAGESGGWIRTKRPSEVETRFRVTEVFLAILWVSASVRASARAKRVA